MGHSIYVSRVNYLLLRLRVSLTESTNFNVSITQYLGPKKNPEDYEFGHMVVMTTTTKK